MHGLPISCPFNFPNGNLKQELFHIGVFMCYQNINAKNKINLHTYGIHLLNPYKTVVSHLNLKESKSLLYIFPTSDYACSLAETLLFMVQSHYESCIFPYGTRRCILAQNICDIHASACLFNWSLTGWKSSDYCRAGNKLCARHIETSTSPPTGCTVSI